MGLHLNFELRLPGRTSAQDVDQALAALRARACELPFAGVSPLCSLAKEADAESAEWLAFWAPIIAEPFEQDDGFAGDQTTARGFLVDPGAGSETATFGFLLRADHVSATREWFWYCSCKTQYSANHGEDHLVACHTSLVALLDHAIALGVDVTVRDETHYWETRNPTRLIDEVRAMNRIIASFAGALSDAMGNAHKLEAPIFEHPEFERFEMGDG